MGRDNSVQRAAYELPLRGQPDAAMASAAQTESASLPEPLLVGNVLWFCRLRWIVVAMLAAFGVAAHLLPDLLLRFGLRPRLYWPFVIGAALALANLGFLAHAGGLVKPHAIPHARGNLWAQIVLDLLAVTVVVHYLGSLETYAAFAYLFHIVLACIFFSRAQSLGVLAVASGFYAACVSLEQAGVLSPATVYADFAIRRAVQQVPGRPLVNVAWALGTWGVVWYLASRLAALVRARDNELAETNRRLVEAQRERKRHMLRTTHELKAPFAAIHANTQLLLRGYCGALPDQALDVVRRIAQRCHRLATEIQEMLQLANLRSISEQPPVRADVDLAQALRLCIAQVQQVAEERRVAIDAQIQPVVRPGVEDHLKMLFSNLLSNALVYSQKGGTVQVRCVPEGANGAVVTIEDYGIGIAAEKLPHIFDEYYRTDEAAQFNAESTGLGLAIVRHVAQTHGIRLKVESAQGAGTRFTLRFPHACGMAAEPASQKKEVLDGIRGYSG